MFDWDDFFALAERLDVEGADEATQRTIISRAYYAAYHSAPAFVRAKGLLRVSHTHALVWGTLMAQQNADQTNVGLRGNWLRQARARADYRNPFPGDLGRQVRDALVEARAIIVAIDALERLG